MAQEKKPKTPEQNLNKMEKVRAGYRRDLKRGLKLMESAQNRLRGAVETSADDIVCRRFRSDIQQAHDLVVESCDKLRWAAFKIDRLKRTIESINRAKELKAHTNAQGSLCQFPFQKALAGMQLE